jgi:hypothetical protein
MARRDRRTQHRIPRDLAFMPYRRLIFSIFFFQDDEVTTFPIESAI